MEFQLKLSSATLKIRIIRDDVQVTKWNFYGKQAWKVRNEA